MATPLPSNTAGNAFSPEYGLVMTNQPATKVVKFGSGYEQRLNVGLNQNPKTFNVTYRNISEADADILTNFFDAQVLNGGSISHQFPTESSSMNFVLDGGYRKQVNYANLATITCTFRQVFEP